jgi:hypothetical protein
MLYMNRLYGSLITGVAAANLVGGCSSSDPVTPHNPETKAVFDQASKYWNDRGFSLLGKTKLVTIGEGEAFECTYPDGSSEDILTNDEGIANFCAGPDNSINTVTISLGAYNELLGRAASKGVSAKTVATIALNHELGHGVQSSSTTLHGSSPAIEQDADCHARIAIDDVFPDPKIINEADEFYHSLDESPTHGTIQQRIAAFNSGSDGTC